MSIPFSRPSKLTTPHGFGGYQTSTHGFRGYGVILKLRVSKKLKYEIDLKDFWLPFEHGRKIHIMIHLNVLK